MLRHLRSTVFTAALICSPLAAHAQESSWSPSVSFGGVTDYVFRGFSQTDEHPAVQGSISLSHDSGFSASIWGSNVDFNDGHDADLEIDSTLSYTLPLGPGKFTLGGIYYAYPGANSSRNYDYTEGFAGYAWNVANTADVNAQVFYSPDFFAGSGDALYTTVGLSVPVKSVEGLAVVGSAGHQSIDDNAKFGAPDYTDWSAGLSYTWNKVSFSAKYFDTNISENRCNGLCDSRVVGALTISLP